MPSTDVLNLFISWEALYCCRLLLDFPYPVSKSYIRMNAKGLLCLQIDGETGVRTPPGAAGKEWIPLVSRWSESRPLPHPIVRLRKLQDNVSSCPSLPSQVAAGSRVEALCGGAWWAGTVLGHQDQNDLARVALDPPPDGEGGVLLLNSRNVRPANPLVICRLRLTDLDSAGLSADCAELECNGQSCSAGL
eukprot:scaffold160263_cov44-Prasinocladus_malaysianus.AAC.2